MGNSHMTLRTTGTCTAVNGKSSSPAFQDLKPGDRIEFSCPLAGVGTTAHDSKAAYVRCVNVRTKTISKLSFNQLQNVLENFTFTDGSNCR